ncbi:hypothetical protein J1N35_019096 [Gossypium stocksii]|uniref:DUF4216 domain-containing protein n=1 Tax=Gossypium stocksii TaxID=47602 RepID=A0A9D4A6S6_9ROSI|nr:hypothetical protein J1N35_019096 [Gossypium stocksii]
MHIEKNVCKNIIGTILNIDRKSKDNLQSQLDLVDMGIRFLCKLKPYCRNKRYPEGSIAEGYLGEECMNFYSRYLEDVETRLNRPSRNAGLTNHNLVETYLFRNYGEPISKVEIAHLDDRSWVQAHRYVLFHYDSIESLCNEYKQVLGSCSRSRRLQHREIHKLVIKSFHEWLGQTVWSGNDVNDEVKWLSQCLNRVVKRYTTFLVNGFKFHPKSHERLKKTQNCGIVVNSSITSYASSKDSNPVKGNLEYYDLLTGIIEFDYYDKQKVVLFQCDWDNISTARGIKKDQFGFTMVNFSRLIHTRQQLVDEPNKMPRRRLRDLSVIQNPPNLKETNSEQHTAIGSLNVLNTTDELAEIQRYLGIIALNANLLPMNYESWHYMPDSNKNQALDNIKERFVLDVSDNYVKKALGKKWRDHKSALKKEYFKKNELSFGQKLGCLQLFDITHRKKDGSPMTTEPAEIMEKLNDKRAEYGAIASSDSSVNLDDIDNQIITKVLGLERYGRVRFQGSFVNPTQYFGSNSQQYIPSGNQAQAEV